MSSILPRILIGNIIGVVNAYLSIERNIEMWKVACITVLEITAILLLAFITFSAEFSV